MARRSKKIPFHTKMLFGVLLGASAGVAAHYYAQDAVFLKGVIHYVTYPLGQIFIRLLLMLVVPLVFSALALGVTGLGDLRSLGRIGLKTLLYTVAVSSVAVFLGIGMTNLFRPGEGISPEVRERLTASAAERAAGLPAVISQTPKAMDLILQIIPRSPVKAAAESDMLAVMFFALMIGIGLILSKSEASRTFQNAIQGLYDVTMKLLDLVISIAPIGVAMLLFTLTAETGYGVIALLAKFVAVVLAALLIHQFVVYSFLVKVLGRMSPRKFFAGIEDAMLTAFSTASSNATLPTAIKDAEENLKLPKHVSRFVLTVGSTMNQNGSALFEGATVLFLAQFYGIDLSLTQQVMVVFICILGGIGTAGVPAGTLPVIMTMLTLIGVPAEGIGLILGVDRFLDMCRTTLNVTGDLAAAVVVSRGEREL